MVTVTLLPASVVPVNVGALLLVRLSVLLTPVSLMASVGSTPVGALGAIVSILIGKLGLCTDSLPDTSVSVKVMACGPSLNGVVGVSVLVAELKVAGTFTPST